MSDTEGVAWSGSETGLAEDIVFVFEAWGFQAWGEWAAWLGTVGVVEGVGSSGGIVTERVAEGIIGWTVRVTCVVFSLLLAGSAASCGGCGCR